MNHYTTLFNIRVTRNSETQHRELKFSPTDTINLDDEYCLRRKSESQAYLIDLLDKEMRD